MVLYDKNGNFVGISKEELSFLGFEDFEEFKSECKDFADLFISKPGYIFKFKNFSWIDYTLHSGAPKKSVVIKLKNGQEVETGLKISQINLVNSINEHDMYYGVELSQASLQTISPAQQPNTSFQGFIDTEQELSPKQSLNVDFDDDFISEEKDLADVKLDFEDDFTAQTSQSEIKEEQDIKLKINDDLYENTSLDDSSETIFESNAQSSISLNQNSSYENEENTEENFISNISFKTYADDSNNSDIDDTLVEQDYHKIESFDEEIHFDFSECAEETGLDLNEIALILEEYLSLIEKTLPILKESITQQNDQEILNAVLPLKGVGQTLQINTLTNVLEKLLTLGNIQEQNEAFEKLENFAKTLKEDLV
jgi:hypothetical protein